MWSIEEIKETQGAKGEGGRLSLENATLGLGLQKNILFILVFFKYWPGWIGSVQSISDFENRNRTKPEFFCDFLIG